MGKKAIIRLPKGKEAKNVAFNIVDGKIEVSYDVEDKFEPKDGDFLIAGERCIFIYNSSYHIHNLFGYYVGVDSYNKIVINKNNKNGFGNVKRLATLQEKQSLLERLEKECGKTWNAEKKCLEDVYVPKFGDIVCIEHPDIECFSRKYVISIFPNKEIPNENRNCFFDIACVNMDGKLNINSKAYYNHGHIRKASESEKQELFDKLKETGKRWNPETKQIEDIRWRAEENELYYYLIVGHPTRVKNIADKRLLFDDVRYESGNYFRTYESAKKVADQIKDIFKNSKPE